MTPTTSTPVAVVRYGFPAKALWAAALVAFIVGAIYAHQVSNTPLFAIAVGLALEAAASLVP